MKYIVYARNLYTYLKNSLISIFSFILLKYIPKKKFSELADKLKNKKVLVLGSGPSLDELNQEMINRYEVIIFLNNSINVIKIFNFENKTKLLFNSDLFRFKQLKKKIYNLDKEWIYVFIPIHLQLFFSFIIFYLKRDIFLIIPKYKIGNLFENNVTKSLITYSLAKNNDTKSILDTNNFRVFPHTVALNAFYFLISCKVDQLHYLGCDFSKGRSSYSNDKTTSNFSNKKIYLWMIKLKKLSENYLIDFKDLKQ